MNPPLFETINAKLTPFVYIEIISLAARRQTEIIVPGFGKKTKDKNG